MVKWILGPDQTTRQPTKTVTQVEMPPGVQEDVAAQIMGAAYDVVARATGAINHHYKAARQNHDMSGLPHMRLSKPFPGGNMDMLFSFGNENVTFRLRPRYSTEPPSKAGPNALSYAIWWPESGWKYRYFTFETQDTWKTSFFTTDLSTEENSRGIAFGGPSFRSQFRLTHPDGFWLEEDGGFDVTLSAHAYQDYSVAWRLFTPGTYELKTFEATGNFGAHTESFFMMAQMKNEAHEQLKDPTGFQQTVNAVSSLFLHAYQYGADKYGLTETLQIGGYDGRVELAEDDLKKYIVYGYALEDETGEFYGPGVSVPMTKQFLAEGTDKRTFSIGSPTWVWLGGYTAPWQREGVYREIEFVGTRVPMMYVTFDLV